MIIYLCAKIISILVCMCSRLRASYALWCTYCP